MEYRKFENKYFIRIDKGEEIVKTLEKICEQNKIKLATLNGIGAISTATIGFFDTRTKKYYSDKLTGHKNQGYEITSLIGNITTKDGETYIHLHITLSDSNHNTIGGHLNSAVVSGTCEIVLDVADGTVERKFNDEVGLNLFKF